MVSGSGLAGALRAGRFVVTAELGPPRGADTDVIREKARALRGWVDAVNITDNQGGFVRLSSLAGSLVLLDEGMDPVMQLTARDRNRIALQSDLVSAAALGVRNVLLLSGDHPSYGDHPDAKPVFDLDSVQMVWTARNLRDRGQLLSGRSLDPPPELHIGAVENPFAPPAGFRARRLAKKVRAGAEYVQTQLVFDISAFTRWMAEVRELGLHERAHIIAGVGPIVSPRALEHMRTKVPGVWVPDTVATRLLRAGTEGFTEEALRLCAESIHRIRDIEGVSGIHLMAFGREHLIPEIVDRSGLDRPRFEVNACGSRERSADAG
ncbi:methylenetetrahydrofolate reductase [Haloechinothrix sp. YIM 98757]|uniref:Methylenetetrahydrofolate reductase n=1 Tax=Haloechinothrix aidingensis TaxID=2752311 RepID=A0A838AD65_9PSEU|nr:methylenetetrahydrofolate reductase [Haloechinothrix aidingensis]MBA0127214.1 methylenetetrahydrofolate reductase [Haloechinothrix aidingensis]